MAGIGTMLGWIFDRLPSRGESLRNAIDKLEREQDDLTKKGLIGDNALRFERNAVKLRKLRETSKNKA